MDAVVERNNLWQAYERVLRNKGAAGVDVGRDASMEIGKQRAWPLVERRREPHERGHSKRFFDALGLVSLLDTQRRFQHV